MTTKSKAKKAVTRTRAKLKLATKHAKAGFPGASERVSLHGRALGQMTAEKDKRVQAKANAAKAAQPVVKSAPPRTTICVVKAPAS